MQAHSLRDPRLLPYYLDARAVAVLVGVSVQTVSEYCRRGVWKRGVHFTQPSRRRIFNRDAILRWIEEADRGIEPVPCSRHALNLDAWPNLAAEIARQRCRV